MNEKEIMIVKQVSEYLQMDEHTVYKLARKVYPFYKNSRAVTVLFSAKKGISLLKNKNVLNAYLSFIRL